MIYFDNAATTKIDEEVFNAMLPYLKNEYYNPDSVYSGGKSVKKAIEQAREQVACSINAHPEQIIFTSGGSESNNCVLKEYAKNILCNNIITSKIEHKSILKTCEELEKKNNKITYLDCDIFGNVSIAQLKGKINDCTSLVSIQYVNNEVGEIQNIKEMIEIVKAKNENTLFHSDAVQAVGKIKIDVNELNIDFMSFSGHKIYGPKGIGVLYVKDKTKINPLISGGQQEFGLRGGTSNVAGIVGIGKACEIIDIKECELGKYFYKELQKLGGKIHGDNKLNSIINVYFENIECQYLLQELNKFDIMISCGSACNSKSVSVSHVISAMRYNKKIAGDSVRFSLGKYNTLKEINFTLEKLKEIISKNRSWF